MGDCIHTPGLLDQAVDLFLHGYGGACEQSIRLPCDYLQAISSSMASSVSKQ